jgi:hypothetical protein
MALARRQPAQRIDFKNNNKGQPHMVPKQTYLQKTATNDPQAKFFLINPPKPNGQQLIL